MGAGECKANGCQAQNISQKDNAHSDHVLRTHKEETEEFYDKLRVTLRKRT